VITAFVSLSVVPGSDEEIVGELLKNPIVEEAWLTTGEYDILLVVKSKEMESINDFVNSVVRRREGVVRAVVTYGMHSIRRG
jgi:DNA-binding Lrp family transcriptional regulator